MKVSPTFGICPHVGEKGKKEPERPGQREQAEKGDEAADRRREILRALRKALIRRIHVLIADDHGLILQAIRLALELEGDIEIVGEAQSGSEVLPLVGATQPDLILLDIRMPDLDGLTILDRMRERYPEVKVVMLSGLNESHIVAEAFERGAVAFLGKGLDPALLAPLLRQVMAGTILRQSFGLGESHGAATAPELGLSEREREILGRVAAGRSNTQIARELWLSEQTVKYHLTNVYKKLAVSSRTEAARYAYEHGLADSTPASPPHAHAGARDRA